ncbi:hypothetical protein BGW39_008857 [Mortierella sp. 14UC]|nr:hypothetical protein BGW39_008857 [Mortierella sp. 14UC]
MGVGNGSSGPTDNSSNSKSSIVAPVVGGIAGFITIALVAFLIFRQRRQRRTNSERLLSSEGHLEEAPDPFKPQSQSKQMQASGSGKSWCESAAASSHKDVIRIAYVPSMASEESIRPPELAALGGGPQASFMASINDTHNKHTSLASTISTGTLNEAIVMAVTNKATPQLLRLHNIKKNNSDMIQRSNSLHSSNSIKRTKSQRRVAEANKSAGQLGASRLGAGHGRGNSLGEGSQLSDALEQLQVQQEEPEQQYTPAVMLSYPVFLSITCYTSDTATFNIRNTNDYSTLGIRSNCTCFPPRLHINNDTHNININPYITFSTGLGNARLPFPSSISFLSTKRRFGSPVPVRHECCSSNTKLNLLDNI